MGDAACLGQHDLVYHAHIQQCHTGVAGEIHQSQLPAQGGTQLGELIEGENVGAVFALLEGDQATACGQLLKQLLFVDHSRAGYQNTIKRPQVVGACSAVLLPQNQVGQS